MGLFALSYQGCHINTLVATLKTIGFKSLSSPKLVNGSFPKIIYQLAQNVTNNPGFGGLVTTKGMKNAGIRGLLTVMKPRSLCLRFSPAVGLHMSSPPGWVPGSMMVHG